MATLLVTKPTVSLSIQHGITQLNHLQQLPSIPPVSNEPRAVLKKSPVSSDYPLHFQPAPIGISHGALRWNSLSDQLSSLSMTSSEKMPVSTWLSLKRSSEQQTPLPYGALKEKAGMHPRSPVTLNVSTRCLVARVCALRLGLFLQITHRFLVCVCRKQKRTAPFFTWTPHRTGNCAPRHSMIMRCL